ncbi:acetyltransferase [Vibrio cholerae]
MVMVVMFEFGVMRCQPLRRALCCSPINIFNATVYHPLVGVY